MKKSTKIWMCLAGIALVVLGVLCIVYPMATNATLSCIFGLIFFMAGCAAMGAWFRLRRLVPQSGLMFISALLQMILGCLIVINPAPIMAALPFLFAFWLMVEGINLMVSSFDFKDLHFKHWWALLCIGILATCFGAWCLFNPKVSAEAVAVIVGVGIILYGVGYWVRIYAINRVEKKLITYRDRFSNFMKDIEDVEYKEVE